MPERQTCGRLVIDSAKGLELGKKKHHGEVSVFALETLERDEQERAQERECVNFSLPVDAGLTASSRVIVTDCCFKGR